MKYKVYKPNKKNLYTTTYTYGVDTFKNMVGSTDIRLVWDP